MLHYCGGCAVNMVTVFLVYLPPAFPPLLSMLVGLVDFQTSSAAFGYHTLTKQLRAPFTQW
jgi:hypothetical protein